MHLAFLFLESTSSGLLLSLGAALLLLMEENHTPNHYFDEWLFSDNKVYPIPQASYSNRKTGMFYGDPPT